MPLTGLDAVAREHEGVRAPETSLLDCKGGGSAEWLSLRQAHATISPWEAALLSLSEADKEAVHRPDTRSDYLRLLDDVSDQAQKASEAARRRHGKWTIRWRGKNVCLYDICIRILHWVDKFKKLGDLMMQYDPTAMSIPWSAVRMAMQVVLLDRDTSDVFLLGVERMVRLISRCAEYERAVSELADGEEQAQLVGLYTGILRFLVSARLFHGKRLPGRIRQSIDQRDEVEKYLDEVHHLEEDWYRRFEVHQWQRKSNNNVAISRLPTGNNLALERVDQLVIDMRKPIDRADIKLFELEFVQQGKRRGEILKWVSPVPYEDHNSQAFDGYIPETGYWLLNHEKYRNWRDAQISQILWLRGDPGTGKTKLTALVVKELRASLEVSETFCALAFFFCNRSEADRRNPESILRTLIKQLSNQSNQAYELVRQEYEAYERSGFAVSSFDLRKCVDILAELLKLFDHSTVVIDALDECDRATRQKLLEALQELCRLAPGKLSMFVSSRNDGDIKTELELRNVPNHYIQPADNESDIQKFVEVSLANVGRRLLRGRASKELKDMIAAKLLSEARGTFVYVSFSIEFLCSMNLESDIRMRLGKMPKGMSETYRVIMDLIQEQHEVERRAAETTLMWLMCSHRPLSPDEMFAALSYAGIDEAWDLDLLLEICRNLVVVDKAQKVLRLTHLTAIEYLLANHFEETRINDFVSGMCLGILDCRAAGSWDLRRRMRSRTSRSLEQYARLYWPFHAQLSESGRGDGSLRQLERFLGRHSDAKSPFVKWMGDCDGAIRDMAPSDRDLVKISRFVGMLKGKPPSPLVFAAVFALRSYVERALDGDQALVDVVNQDGHTLLILAARMGHTAVAELLMARGADLAVSMDDEYCIFANALQAAAVCGKVETARVLLGQQGRGKKDLDTPGGRFGSAVCAAAYHGHASMVEFLKREQGAASRPENSSVGHVLHAAARSGNLDLVEDLLDDGEDVNGVAGRYGTALACAVYGDDIPMAKLLLDRGAEVNSPAHIYGSPLHLAVVWGNDEMIKLLLSRGADVLARDASWRTPFHETVTKGRLRASTIDILLEARADPFFLDDAGWSARDEAVWRGCTDIVDFLESRGITADKEPPNSPLKDKSQPGLVRAALGEAFRDFDKDRHEPHVKWMEYALPILRFSAFYLGLRQVAVRAAREWALRWDWQCDGCKRNYGRESFYACTVCHSTSLCYACYRLRRRDLEAAAQAAASAQGGSEGSSASSTVVGCDRRHGFESIDIAAEPGEAPVWAWAADVRDELVRTDKMPEKTQEMLRFDRNRRTWAENEQPQMAAERQVEPGLTRSWALV